MHNDGLETSSFDIPDDFAVDFVAGRVRESLNCDEQDLLIEAGVLVFGDVAAFLDPSVSCSRIETVEVGLVEQEVGEEDDESKPSFFAKVKSSESDDVRRRNIGPSGLDVESIPECPPGCIRLVGFDKAVSPSRYYDVPLGDFWLKAYRLSDNHSARAARIFSLKGRFFPACQRYRPRELKALHCSQWLSLRIMQDRIFRKPYKACCGKRFRALKLFA